MKKNKALYQVHISVFLFGFAGLFGKWIHLDALSIVWGRVFFASMAFGIWFLWKRTNPFKIARKDYAIYLFLGALLAFHWWSFFNSIQLSTVAIGLFSYSSFPVFTSFLEPLFLKKPWRPIGLLLAGISVIGIYLILPDLSWGSAYTQGVFWGVMSGLSFAFLTVFNRYLLISDSFTRRTGATKITFFQDFFAMICLTPFLLINPPLILLNDWYLLILLGVVFTALAHLLYIHGLKSIEARTASLISNMEPVYGVLFAFVLMGEKPTGSILIGGALILGAALWSARVSKT